MAWVERLITRTTQPQDACGVDWNNPLAFQLTSAWWGDSNFIGPAGANKLGAYGVVGSVGAGRFLTAGSVTVLPANSFGYTESESRLAVIKVPSGINRNISSTSAIGAVQLRTANGTDLVYVEKQIAVKISAAGVLSVGETCVVGVSRDASTAKLYKSGRLIGTSAGRVLAASSLPAIGQDGTGAATFEGDIYLHLAWSRVLSDSEFKSLSENPWQIFEPEVQRIWVPDATEAPPGTTTVTKDTSASYNVAGSVQADAAAQYAIASAVTQDASASYAIRAAVQSDASASYSLIAATSVTADASASYAVQAQVFADAVASYQIQSASSVSSDANAQYQIRGTVQSDASLAYELRGAVQADAAANYIVLGNAQNDTVGSYFVRGNVQSEASALYAVSSFVGQSVTLSYTVEGAALPPSVYFTYVPTAAYKAYAPIAENQVFAQVAKNQAVVPVSQNTTVSP